MRQDTLKRHLKSHKQECIFCGLFFLINDLLYHYTQCVFNPENCKQPNTKNSSSITSLPIQSNLILPIQPTTSTITDNPIAKQEKMFHNLITNVPPEKAKFVIEQPSNLYLEEIQKNYRLIYKLDNLFPWQQQIIDMLKIENYQQSKINVLLDEEGQIGKSSLLNHLRCINSFNNNYLCISGCKNTDLHEAYNKIRDNLKCQYWNVIFDFDRSVKETPSFVEQITDGKIPTPVYTKKPLFLGKVNVFIFCNTLDSISLLSIDRLTIYTINNNMCLNKIKIKRNVKNKFEIINRSGFFDYNTLNYTCVDKNLFSCNYCKLTCTTKFNIIRHLELNCKKYIKLECKNCLSNFNNEIDFNLHKLKCINKCKRCNKKFEYALELDIHSRKCKGVGMINFNNTIINNYNNVCTSCNLPCEKMFCEKCIYITSNIPIKCKYCTFIIKPCDMFDHIQESHKNKILSM